MLAPITAAHGDGGQEVRWCDAEPGNELGGGQRTDGVHAHLALGQGGEGEVCGRVVQERRESSGQPEVLPGLGDADRRSLGLEERQRGDHGGEDAGEEHSHLGDRPPAEMVGGAGSARTQLQRKDGQHDQNDLPHEGEVDALAKVAQLPGESDGRDDQDKEDDVHGPFEPHGHVVGLVHSPGLRRFPAELFLLRDAVGVDLDTQTVMDNLSASEATGALVGLYLVPFSGIAFLWFIGVIRDRIGEREDRFFATVFLGGGLLFIAMLFAAAAVLGGLIAGNRFGTASPTDLATVGFARSVGYSFLFVYAAKAAGVFVLATSTIVRRARWPRWTSLSGFLVAAVLLLSVSFFEPIVMLLPAWVTAISIYVLVTGGRTATDGEAR